MRRTSLRCSERAESREQSRSRSNVHDDSQRRPATSLSRCAGPPCGLDCGRKRPSDLRQLRFDTSRPTRPARGGARTPCPPATVTLEQRPPCSLQTKTSTASVEVVGSRFYLPRLGQFTTLRQEIGMQCNSAFEPGQEIREALMTSASEAIRPYPKFSQYLYSFLRAMKLSKASPSSENVVENRKDTHKLEKTTISSRLQSALGKFSAWLRTILGEQDQVIAASGLNSPTCATRTEKGTDSEESFTDEKIHSIQVEFWEIVKKENNRYVTIPDHTKVRRGVYAVAPSPFAPDIAMVKELLDRQEQD